MRWVTSKILDLNTQNSSLFSELHFVLLDLQAADSDLVYALLH